MPERPAIAFVERLLVALARWAMRLAGGPAEWSEAWLAELEAIEGSGDRLRWSLGGLRWTMAVLAGGWRPREIALVPLAALAGLGVAYIDSRPTWDDTGITAGVLLIAAAASAAVAGRRPWLWALLVGVWTPAFEIALSHQLGSLVALVFAAAGAAGGHATARALRTAPSA
ncbi:MAG: hypothetical protein ABR525_01515 [Candidatus Limnocylindria bacterium]